MRAHMTKTGTHKIRRQTGVSLLELMITLAVGMVLVAMATPLVNTTINMYRLRGAGTDYANLLQQTRMRAVADDRYYAVYASTSNGPVALWNGFNAFADINRQGGATGQYQSAGALGPDLGVVFNHGRVLLRQRALAPATNDLEAKFMPGVNAAFVAINPNTNWSAGTVMVVTFGPRGLPCYLPAAPPALDGGTCPYTVPGVVGAQPVAYESFFQNPQTTAWEAITINPSGRIRAWRYNVADATWQPLN